MEKLSKRRRDQKLTKTRFEDFSTEIFFEIFDYLTGNEIYKSFFGLNHRFNELIWNTANIHLNLSCTTTKFRRNVDRLFPKQNITSISILYKNVQLLKTLFNSIDECRLRSISILNVPLCGFETSIPEMLNTFKYQLNRLKIDFTDMCYTGTGARAAQSFAYLLTELPMLKQLVLNYSEGIDPITYMPLAVINNTITNLTLTLYDANRLAPLLYRFEQLIILNIHFPKNIRKMGLVRCQATEYYRHNLSEKTSTDYPMKIRHIHIYNCFMLLDRVDQIFKFISSPNLVTVNLCNCKHPVVRSPMGRRELPFIDGAHWHDLLAKYLSSSVKLKLLHIEYPYVGATMSVTSLAHVKEKLMKYNRSTSSWSIHCSYNQEKYLLVFDFLSA
ncbi:unnamed protein product [Adineta ricciae]|uniref:F-box domain-containing protein n=1 Tax=Adineta ricciae TaxID=249248 RepID=A0A815YKQ0_ADIRI|nr:unnamed protein product [Adineta ricciae]CAF1573040.1 unnamed protein product [Adineta ricciae]